MNNFDKLTELQKNVGYAPGPINMIALLGTFGEAGEVLAEFLSQYSEGTIMVYQHLRQIKSAVQSAEAIDELKKLIRDKHITIPDYCDPTHKLDEDAFDKEIADQLYYLNALAICRGYTLDHYAGISYDKVSKRIQQNIQHGVDHLEMPQEKKFLCKECETEYVKIKGHICGKCEFAREQ